MLREIDFLLKTFDNRSNSISFMETSCLNTGVALRHTESSKAIGSVMSCQIASSPLHADAASTCLELHVKVIRAEVVLRDYVIASFVLKACCETVSLCCVFHLLSSQDVVVQLILSLLLRIEFALDH